MKNSAIVVLMLLSFSKVASSQGAAPSIRSIDFANFTHPGTKAKLVNGKQPTDNDPMYLASVIYGDVTGDDVEEALVVLFTSVRGSAIPYDGYIYALRNRKPRLLWSFSTGDRADGGLRQMYADRGYLVIELYGNGTRVGGKLYGRDGSACCPSFFTRNHYQWRGNRFARKGHEVILPNVEKHGSLVMPRYQRTRQKH